MWNNESLAEVPELFEMMTDWYGLYRLCGTRAGGYYCMNVDHHTESRGLGRNHHHEIVQTREN